MAAPVDAHSHVFRCPPLSDDDAAMYTQLAERTARELVAYAALEGGPIHWKHHAIDETFQVYRGTDKRTHSTNATDRIWCAFSEMHATLDEVQLMVCTETSEDFKAYHAKFHSDTLDAARLYNITVPPTEPSRPLAPFVGINWVLQKSPGKVLVRNRDWCFVEGQFEMQVNGRRAWIRVFKSVHLACVPELQADCGFARGHHVRSGVIFVETDSPGILGVVQLNHSHVKGESSGKVTDWLYATSMVQRFKHVADLQHAIRKYRLSQTTFLPMAQVTAVETVDACTVCAKLFDKAKKLNCRKCGDVVCRHCSQLHQVKYQGQWVEVRVCEPCVFGQSHPRRRSSVAVRLLSSKSSTSDEGTMRLRPGNSSLASTDVADDELYLHWDRRDTLIESTLVEAWDDRTKPIYQPAMAGKFNVTKFFATGGDVP
ncbi:Aste57867_14058 [Aphanomyces stellatus]|uniref:Aste57867_14058 protein n=1 Tax=Aphanomyces stellatus TaxID=120398 RepID=A0A485L1D1_9STRA|nr:hypothetical protein As57867_014007 [Aphanomyces stellatus]VFT90886.1 Aste57867_14058 [Aphanomyces stellatus]